MLMKNKILWPLLGVCLLLVASCQKEPQPVKVTGITVNPTSLSLTEGESADLTATVSPSNADNQSVTWDSNDKSVATVSNGKVTALKAGSTSITVKSVDGGFTASCAVTVVAKTIDVSSVTLSKSELTLTEGESETITATVKPDDATDKTVSWSSSDPAVATVEGGKITAVKEGTATITAKAGDKTATCKVTVEKKVIAVESVELDKTELELTEGGSATLVATVKPDNATDKTVTWTSSDPEVATVDGGVVTAVKEGTATITAKAGDKTAACEVTVKKNTVAVESVELDKSELELAVGESATLVATVKPDDATDKTVTWSSSDPEIATVDGGVVTAVKGGTATITASAGDKTATCAVTVKADEHPLAALFGDYTFYSLVLGVNEKDEDAFMYGNWDMKISPYEGNPSRIWIDKVTIFQAPDVYGRLLSEGDVYADVSEDMKTITIPVPQTVKSTAEEGFDEKEPFILYLFDENFDAVTTPSVITFTLQEDGKWKTEDNYGFSTKSAVKEDQDIYFYFLNCFGGVSIYYPTYFVKNEDAAAQSKLSPARTVSVGRSLSNRGAVRPPFRAGVLAPGK